MRKLLKRGMVGPDVEALQENLTSVGIKCVADGMFGPRTAECVQEFQERRILLPDSIAGPKTQGELSACLDEAWTIDKVPWMHKTGVMVYGSEHPDLGTIPATFGKSSCFGGPKDRGDRMYGQSLVAAKTPAQVYERYPELVDLGVFSEGVDKLPPGMGISWMLNPDSFYCAMRWPKAMRAEMVKAPHMYPILVGLPSKDLWCLVVPTDYGPAKWTKRNSDMAYGVKNRFKRALGKLFGWLKWSLTNKTLVHGWAVGPATKPIGPVPR